MLRLSSFQLSGDAWRWICNLFRAYYNIQNTAWAECRAELSHNERPSAAMSALLSCHVNVAPHEGARRPIRASHQPLCGLIAWHTSGPGWQLSVKLSWWCVFPLWLITSQSEVLHHLFLLSLTLTPGCLSWPLSLQTARQSRSTRCCWACNHAEHTSVGTREVFCCSVAELYKVSCHE